jgi:hypothetical protein
MTTSLIRRFILPAILTAFSLPSAQAFKTETHVWVGQQVINDLADDGKITVRLRGKLVTIDVPADVRAAILNNRTEFLLGNIGPDSAPDILVGQTVVHPGNPYGWKTNDWLQYLLDSSRNNPAGKAYTYGYLGHAAADTFAHTYVNQYSGDIFNLSDETQVEERHIALEGFIAKLTPPLVDHTGKPLGTITSLIKPTNAFGTFVRDTLVMNDTVDVQHRSSMYGGHLSAYYHYRQSIDKMAQDPRWNQIDAAVLRIIAMKFNVDLSNAQSQKIIDKANQIIPKLQRKENAIQGAANEILLAAEGLDEKVFQNIKSTANSMIKLENEVIELHFKVSDLERKIRRASSCLPGDFVCKKANDLIDDLNRKINDQIRPINNTLNEKRNKLLELTYSVRDAATKGQKLVRIVTNAAIDFAQRMGSNTSPIKAALLGWRNDVDVAMLEYTKATSQMILNSTDRNADSLEPMKRWFSCYHMSILGVPQEISGCEIRDGAKDVMWAVDRVTKLAEDLASINELLGLPSPADIRAWQQEQIDRAKKDLQAKIFDRLLPKRVQDIIALFKVDMTDDELNKVFNRIEMTRGKGLYWIQDMPARVRAEMYVKNGAFDPEKYAVARNSVTLAKLALLDKTGLARLAQLADAPLDADGQPPFFNTDNIVAGAFASIDGNHQWMTEPPPRPSVYGAPYVQPESYAAPAGFIPWRQDVRTVLFRGLFIGPLSPGVDAPRSIGFPALHPADYPYRPCPGNPFPSSSADKTCAFLDVFPAIMDMMK